MVSPAYLVSGEVGRVALVAVPSRRHRVRPVLSVAARRPLPAVVLLKVDLHHVKSHAIVQCIGYMAHGHSFIQKIFFPIGSHLGLEDNRIQNEFEHVRIRYSLYLGGKKHLMRSSHCIVPRAHYVVFL